MRRHHLRTVGIRAERIARWPHAARHAPRTRTQGTAGAPNAVRIAMQYVGARNPTRTRGPWCGDFMNLIEHRARRPGIASRRAVDWRHYGHGSAPVAGAIVVFRGHVGRVVERKGDKIEVISGNYGHRVGIGVYNIRSAIAYRMP